MANAHTPANGELKPLSLEELQFSRQEWQLRRKAAAATVAELEAEAGLALLRGDTSARQALAEARARLNECDLVLAEIENQQPEAQAHERLNRAAELRRQAKELIEQAQELDAKVKPLLDEIERLQGVRYVAPAVGQFSGRYPKSDELRRRADTMIIQAENLEFSAQQILPKRNGHNGHH